MLLKLDEMRGAGLAQLAELNAAVQRFKTSGKTVVAYAPSYDQASYLAASHADEVVMDPMGALLIEGFSSYGNYVKGLTDKLGITMNVFRVGEYKSAVEPFLRTDMSDEARAANQAWLEDLWRRYGMHVGEGRGLDADATHQFVEALPQRMAEKKGRWAEIALDAGLVTHVETLAEFRDRMRVGVGTDPEHGSFRQVHFQRYLAATDEPAHSALRVGGVEPAAIARVVVQGDIVNGRSDIGLSGGDTVSRLLNDAQRDAVALGGDTEDVEAQSLGKRLVDAARGSLDLLFGIHAGDQRVAHGLYATIVGIGGHHGLHIALIERGKEFLHGRFVICGAGHCCYSPGLAE